MRIISQDGKHDFPYDFTVLSLEVLNDGRTIINADYQNNQIVFYSSKEKAQKAMDMLHEAYIGLPYIFQNIDVQDDVVDIFKKHGIDGIIVSTDDTQQKVERIGNTIFRFPQDDEIEMQWSSIEQHRTEKQWR